MQTCSKCNAQSPDLATTCISCGADLREYSLTNISLKRLQANPRVKNIRLIVAEDACPVCLMYEATYPKDEVPKLPIAGCSHGHGCRCFYQPSLSDLYP